MLSTSFILLWMLFGFQFLGLSAIVHGFVPPPCDNYGWDHKCDSDYFHLRNKSRITRSTLLSSLRIIFKKQTLGISSSSSNRNNNRSKQNSLWATSKRKKKDPIEDNNGEGKNGNEYDDNDDFQDISDAEALLACRAYLQKKNRLGSWSSLEQRKDADSQRSIGISSSTEECYSSWLSTYDHSKKGFFWEDPNELKYYNSGTNDDYEDEQEQGTNSSNDNYEYKNKDNDDDDDNNDSLWEMITNEDVENVNEEEEGLFFSGPSPSYIRRSKASQKMWSDPDFRAKWYERRWGDKKAKENHPQQKKESTNDEKLVGRDDTNENNNNESLSRSQGGGPPQKKEKSIKRRVQSLPSNFLEEPALLEMSEEEISYAIRSYIQASRKRRISRKKSLQQRKDELNDNIPFYNNVTTSAFPDVAASANSNKNDETNKKTEVTTEIENKFPRNSLFQLDPQLLMKKRQERSERSAKAYKTRLDNKSSDYKGNKKKKETLQGVIVHNRNQRYNNVNDLIVRSHKSTPQDALRRIEIDLSANQLPAIEDIELIRIPGRMNKRKDVLRRILSEQFNLRGKCVPIPIPTAISENSNSNNCDGNSNMTFVTQCTMDELCDFVIYTIQKDSIQKSKK